MGERRYQVTLGEALDWVQEQGRIFSEAESAAFWKAAEASSDLSVWEQQNRTDCDYYATLADLTEKLAVARKEYAIANSQVRKVSDVYTAFFEVWRDNLPPLPEPETTEVTHD